MSLELTKREKQEVRQTSAEQLVDAGNAYSPDVDIVDTGNEILFIMDVPGVSKGDVQIVVDENNVLSVSAKTSYHESDELVYREFNSGNYFRAFTLNNELNKDAIGAKIENGVLEISVPRREEAKPRKIEISA